MGEEGVTEQREHLQTKPDGQQHRVDEGQFREGPSKPGDERDHEEIDDYAENHPFQGGQRRFQATHPRHRFIVGRQSQRG